MIRLYTDMQRSWVDIRAVVILCLFCRHSFTCGAVKTTSTQVLEREARSQSLRGSYSENPLFLTSYKAKSRLTIWNQAYRTVCRLMRTDSIK